MLQLNKNAIWDSVCVHLCRYMHTYGIHILEENIRALAAL